MSIGRIDVKKLGKSVRNSKLYKAAEGVIDLACVRGSRT